MRLPQPGMAWAVAILLEVSLVLAAVVDKRQTTASNTVVAERMCYLARPQTAMIRDVIYIDGGETGWLQTLANGNPNLLQDFGARYKNQIYYINLTQPFEQAKILSNVSTLIRTADRPELAPAIRNGHLLSNDYELILYGGLMDDTDSIDIPDVTHWAIAKDIYEHEPAPLLKPGAWRNIVLDGVNRNVAAGAYVSVPWEDLAFVFGGSRGATWEEIRGDTPRQQYLANTLSRRLVTVDLETMASETWTNDTAPAEVSPRSAGELVWIPIGQKGALVLLGGTSFPINVTTSTDTTLITPYITTAAMNSATALGKEFMEIVQVYDIANKVWYQQTTTGDIPPPTAEFCTVVGSSTDGTSHQIYAYGGYSGTTFGGYQNSNGRNNTLVENYDHVYVLSIPSFQWKKVYDGTTSNGRRGHRCHKISDNRMMVIGGIATGSTCLSGEFLRIFNLNTLTFEDAYQPDKQDAYKVPQTIIDIIGGDENGNSDAVAAETDDTDLENLLAIKYPKAITTYWPFNAVSDPVAIPTATGNVTTIKKEGGGSGLPNYVPPLLGVILGLLVLITILCGILFWLRRRKQREARRMTSDSGTSGAFRKKQTWSWLKGLSGASEKGDFYSPGSVKDPLDTTGYEVHPVEAPEDAVLHELGDTSIAAEIPDTDRRVSTIRYSDQVQPELGGNQVHPEQGGNDTPPSQRPPLTSSNHRPSLSQSGALGRSRTDSVLSEISPMTEIDNPVDSRDNTRDNTR